MDLNDGMCVCVCVRAGDSGTDLNEGVSTLTDLQGLDLKTDGLGTRASRR